MKKVYNCLACGTENIWGRSKVNKYCDNKCQGQHKWVSETKPDIIAGNRSEPSTLKKFLVEEFGEKCAECGQEGTWNNKPLVLQLDHIDGDSDNNFPKNLRLLCPNCHTQTENFGSKGQGSRYKKVSKRNEYLREYKKGL